MAPRRQRQASGSGWMPRLNRLVCWRVRGEPCVPATRSVYFAQGGVDLAMSRCVPPSATAFTRIAKTLPEKLCGDCGLCAKYTEAATVLVLGDVVSGRGAVGTSEGEKVAEWRRDTKSSERLRPYAAAESLGTLAGKGRTLRTCSVERTLDLFGNFSFRTEPLS